MSESPISLLQRRQDDEEVFLSGRRDRGEELAGAIRVFGEFLHGLDALQVLDRPCVTVFGSARTPPGRRFSAAARPPSGTASYALASASTLWR